MDAAYLLGLSATISTFIFFSIASPSQIIKHYREKRVGLTGFYAAWPGVSHLLWLSYGLAIHNPFLIYVNIFAALMIGVICWQKFWIYRDK